MSEQEREAQLHALQLSSRSSDNNSPGSSRQNFVQPGQRSAEAAPQAASAAAIYPAGGNDGGINLPSRGDNASSGGDSAIFSHGFEPEKTPSPSPQSPQKPKYAFSPKIENASEASTVSVERVERVGAEGSSRGSPLGQSVPGVHGGLNSGGANLIEEPALLADEIPKTVVSTETQYFCRKSSQYFCQTMQFPVPSPTLVQPLVIF